MITKTYTGTTDQILEQLRKDLNPRPMEERGQSHTVYPFNSDGLSDATFAEQLANDFSGDRLFNMEFIQDEKGDVFGTMQSIKVRILKG